MGTADDVVRVRAGSPGFAARPRCGMRGRNPVFLVSQPDSIPQVSPEFPSPCYQEYFVSPTASTGDHRVGKASPVCTPDRRA